MSTVPLKHEGPHVTCILGHDLARATFKMLDSFSNLSPFVFPLPIDLQVATLSGGSVSLESHVVLEINTTISHSEIIDFMHTTLLASGDPIRADIDCPNLEASPQPLQFNLEAFTNLNF
jgi:hypothetical protein